MVTGKKIGGTFDTIRGVSSEISSKNNLNNMLQSPTEMPRLKILENFKEINKMLRENYIKNKTSKGLTEEEKKK